MRENKPRCTLNRCHVPFSRQIDWFYNAFTRKDATTLDDAIRATHSQSSINGSPGLAWTTHQSDTHAFIRESIQAWKEDRAWDYSIRIRKNSPVRHIGNISFWTVSKLGKIAEIGYWVRSDETKSRRVH